MKYASRVLSVCALGLLTLTLFAGTSQSRVKNPLPFTANDSLEDIRYKIAYNGYSFTVAENWVTALSPEERARLHSRHYPLSPRKHTINDDIGPLAKYLGRKYLPATFDWRSYNGRSYIGAVRDQGTCGSCYAFGASACAEGTFNLALGKYLKGSADNRSDFSEAFIAFCLRDEYSGFDGCDGADYDYDELTAATVQGYGNESDFPYTETDPGACTHWGIQTYVFKSWHRVPCGDITAIKTAIMTYGVVDAAINAESAFDSYSGGCFDDTQTDCSASPCYYTTTNHAISLVGWDDNPPEGGGGVWILRNSWGTSWGESGYMRCRFTAMHVACEVCYLVYGAPIVNETFDNFDSGTRPSGWTFNNCNSDSDTYTASTQYGVLPPSIKLDATGDAITTATFSGPEKLSFWLKGISLTGTADALLVEEHYGGSWTTVTDIDSLPSSETIAGPFYLASNSDQLRFTYNKSSSGNLAIDDIRLLGITPTPTPVGFHTPATTPTSTPTAGPPTATPTAYIPPPSPTPTAYNPPASPTPTAYQPPATATPTAYIPPATATPTAYIPPATATPTAYIPPATATPTAYIPPATATPTAGPATPTPAPTAGPILIVGANDYDGDGTADIALWRPSAACWYIRGQASIYYGTTGDIPVPGDFNGDGTADLAVFRPQYGKWWLRPAGGGPSLWHTHYGLNGDIPVPADYDGDFCTDTAVWRPSSGCWYVKGQFRTYYGKTGDLPVPGDYDGDGSADIAVYRQFGHGAAWYFYGTPSPVYYGRDGDMAVPGDYNGDGTTQLSVFRPSSGRWYIRGDDYVTFGQSGDLPLAFDYEGDGTVDRTLFRASNGSWIIYGVTTIYYGLEGDQPVSGSSR